MEGIFMSEAMLDIYAVALRTKVELFPHQAINPFQDESENVRYTYVAFPEKEYEWFQEHFAQIYENRYPFFCSLHTEDEVHQMAYAIYIHYLYKHYKECPVPYDTFRQWFLDESFHQAPVLEVQVDAELHTTFEMLLHGERLNRYSYLIKESIERCTDPKKPLSEQKEMVDSIVSCFELRYERETENLNIGLLLVNLDADVLTSNITYQRMELDGIYTHVDNVQYFFPYDHEFYPGWVKQYRLIKSRMEAADEEPITETAFSEEEREELYENASKPQDDTDEQVAAVVDYSKHFWILRSLFVKHGLDVLCIRDKEEHVALIDEENILLRYDNGTFYRESGEEILNLDVLAHEICKIRAKYDEESQQADKRAREHLMNFLKPEQRILFEEKGFIQVEGNEYEFILHNQKQYNNIIRIEKANPENKRTMCVIPEDVRISSYDVLATVLLLVKCGREHELKTSANLFPLDELDQKIINDVREAV